jgi:concentrative nucleoside transporter, CNT family
MAPVCWLMGIPWSRAVTAGGLMGIKTVLNELVAYLQLAALPDGALDPRSRVIMLYAMRGFANFGSLGIMIAGLSTMCPGKRTEVVSLAQIDRVGHADHVPPWRDRRDFVLTSS